jgi:hypothetical protein
MVLRRTRVGEFCVLICALTVMGLLFAGCAVKGELGTTTTTTTATVSPSQLAQRQGCTWTYSCPMECEFGAECCPTIICPGGQGLCWDCDNCLCAKGWSEE